MRKLIEEYGLVIFVTVAISLLFIGIKPLKNDVNNNIEDNIESVTNKLENGSVSGGTEKYTYTVIAKSQTRELSRYNVAGNKDESYTLAAKTFSGYNTPESQVVKFDAPRKEIIFNYEPIKYRLDVDFLGGVYQGDRLPEFYTIESENIKLPTSVKRGSNAFLGYKGVGIKEPKKDITIFQGTTGDIKYEAVYDTTEYVTIKFNTNGAPAIAGRRIIKGTSLGSLPTVSKNNYIFNGWYIDGSGTQVTKDTIFNNDVTITAKFTKKKFVITFDANGGTVTPDSKELTFDEAIGILPTPTRNGYTFEGWFTARDGGMKVDSSYVMKPANMTLFARWNKELTYVLETGLKVNTKLREIDANNKIKSIEFVDIVKPATGVTEITGLDLDNDGGIIGWYCVDEVDNMAKVYISTQTPGQKVIANKDSSRMFSPTDREIFGRIEKIDVEKLDVTQVINMSSMFSNVSRDNTNSFTIVGLNNWDVSKVTNMNWMFNQAGQNAKTWNIGDLSSWNVSNVVNMSSMFNMAGNRATTWNIGDLKNWNVGKVVNISSMFANAGETATIWNIGNLSSWDVGNIKDMSYMFNAAGYSANIWDIGDLTNWNVSNVTNMDYMFFNSGFNSSKWNIGNIGSWKVNNVTNMEYMFGRSGSKTSSWSVGNLSSWDVSNVTNMSHMFYSAGCYSTIWSVGNISNWNTKNVSDMSGMFLEAGCNSQPFTVDLSNWDASNVTDMRGMFSEIGANKIMIPKNISNNVQITGQNVTQKITSKPWYDITDNNREYLPGTFPVGNGNVSHTLVDTKPVSGPRIHYHSNIPGNDTVISENVTTGSEFTFKPADTFVYDGHLFDFWGESPDGMGSGYYPGTSMTYYWDNDLHLYAQWKAERMFTVTLQCNPSYGRVEGSGTYPSGTKVTIKAIPLEGKEFVQWSDGDTNAVREIVVDKTIDLTAQFRNKQNQQYKIYYHFNLNGINSSTSQLVTYGQTYNLKGADTFSYPGWTFTNWSDAPTGGTVYFANQFIRYNLTTDLHLYAQWKQDSTPQPVRYQVILGYNSSQGTCTGAGYYDEGTTVTLRATPHSGYEFVRWSDGVTSATRSFTIRQNVSLSAEFRKTQKFNVTLTSNVYGLENNLYGAGTYNYMDTVTISANNSNGYTFKEWRSVYSDGTSSSFSTSSTFTFTIYGDMNLQAVYDTKTYGKTYNLVDGNTFNKVMHEITNQNSIISIIFTDSGMPSNGVTKINGLDADGDGGIVGWYSIDYNGKSTVYISTQKANQKVVADVNCTNMFSSNWSSTNSLNQVKHIDLSMLDVSNVANMNGMFYNCGYDSDSFTIKGMDNWDVSKVLVMDRMFAYSGKNATTWNVGDLSNWYVGNVTSMNFMFEHTGYTTAKTWYVGDISKWNVQNVKNMGAMFFSAGVNANYYLNLSSWNVAKVKEYGSFNYNVENKIISPNWVY